MKGKKNRCQIKYKWKPKNKKQENKNHNLKKKSCIYWLHWLQQAGATLCVIPRLPIVVASLIV